MADAIGSLARVDGALVLSSSLRVLSFGAKISGVNGELVAQAAANVWGDSGGEYRPRGMRHSSGLYHAQEHPGVVVFVFSEDGVISCFLSNGDTTRVWTPVALDSYLSADSYSVVELDRQIEFRQSRQPGPEE